MTAHIYIKKWEYGGFFNWDNAEEIPFTEYSIDETDYRNRTAKIKTNWLFNINERSYAVKITNPTHETFTGIILKRDVKPHNVHEYSCQDWNRLYMGKPNYEKKDTTHNLIKYLLSWANYGWNSTNGLLSVNKYEQSKYGSTIGFNPMKNQKTISVKDKTVKEIIENLVYGQRPFIDIHYNNVGIMQFTPYYLDKWMDSVADFHYTECVDWSWNFDTTDIITKVTVGNQSFTFDKLFNSKYNQLANFTFTGLYMDDSSKTETNTDKTNNKTSNTNTKTNNPYGTKNKEVWVNMDNCWSSSADHTYFNTFCKELQKLGWKVHKVGVGPGYNTNYSKASACKNGIWLTIDNGVDCEVFRHMAQDKWFKGQLVKHKSKAVLGLINNAGNIKKGGRYYKYLGMAWDGTGKGQPGLKYPAGFLAACGTPFFYSKGNNPKDAAKRFNAGGDSQVALQNDYNKVLKGFYSNWNWGNKY